MNRGRLQTGHRPLLDIRYVASFRSTVQRGDYCAHSPGGVRRSQYRRACALCMSLRFGRAGAMVQFRRDMRLRGGSGALRYRFRNLGCSPRISSRVTLPTELREAEIHRIYTMMGGRAGNLRGVKKPTPTSARGAAAIARRMKESVRNIPTQIIPLGAEEVDIGGSSCVSRSDACDVSEVKARGARKGI